MFFLKKAYLNNINLYAKIATCENLKNFIYLNKFNFSSQSQPTPTKKDAGTSPKATQGSAFPEYKAFEDITKPEVKANIKNFRKDIFYHYGSINNRESSKNFNKMEFVAKNIRRMWIQSGDFSTNKHILPIKRLRTKDDTLFQLLKNGEIAAVIEGREEFPDFHFILDKKFTKKLDNLPMSKARPFYLKHGTEEIKCTLIEKERLPSENQPYKIRFQRFIPGRPNLIKLDIKIIGKALNPVLADMDAEIVQHFYNVLIWTKVEDYPPILEIDTRLVFPNKPFKFIDLSNMLPEGIWLHRKYDSVMHNAIVSMSENYNYFLSSTAHPIDDATNLTLEKTETEEDAQELKDMQEMIEQAHKSKKKKKPVTMPFTAVSSKKMMQTKNDGADPKALRKLMLGSKGGGDKKAKGKK